MGSLGKLGDIIVNGEPLKKYIKKQTRIEANNQYSSDISSINRLVKGRIKEKIIIEYDKTPSKINHWTEKEILWRNIMEKTIDESNTQIEMIIGCIQKLEGEFSTQDIVNLLYVDYNIEWPKSKISSIMYIIYNTLNQDSENIPNLISKKSKTGKRGNLYSVTEEFKKIPKQNLYEIIKETLNKNKKKKGEKNNIKEQKIEITNPQTKSTITYETNLVDLVQQLRPRSIVIQDADGAITIVVM